MRHLTALLRAATVAALTIVPSITFAIAQDRSKPARDAAADKGAQKYRVEMRLEVSPELDKLRVIAWTDMLRSIGVSSISEVNRRALLNDSTEPPIESSGANRVLIRAVLGPAGNLFIGADGYRIADRPRLEKLVKQLREEGVPGPDPSSPLWGLSQAQFDLLQAQLKLPALFDLDDQPLAAFVSELRARTKFEIKLTPEVQGAAGSMRLTHKVDELSLGAALAYVLGQHGLAFEPRQGERGSVSLLILPIRESKRPWPVGLAPEKFPANVAPRLMATARYQTKDNPIEDVLGVFSRELQMPVLLDRAALASRNLDLASLRSTVQVPGGTFLSAIRKTLAPLGLKHELRIDEASRPFLWVTVMDDSVIGTKKKQAE